MKKIADMIEINNTDIADLLPHSGNMVLLDRVIGFAENVLIAELRVRGDGLFGDDQAVPAWAGMEYMAQAVAAYAGVNAKRAGEPIKLGFLLGTRRYNSNVAEFKVGTLLTIRAELMFQDENLGVFECSIQGTGIEVSANLNVYQSPRAIITYEQDRINKIGNV